MKPILAIWRLTLRGILSSNFIHLLILALAAGALLIPFVGAGDGTVAGLFQIITTYGLAYVNLLASMAAIWLGCTVTGNDVTTRRIHLVVSKPVSAGVYLVGKWMGVCSMMAAMLLMASTLHFLAVRWKLNRVDISDEERRRFWEETYVGRRVFHPSAEDFERAVADEIRKQAGKGLFTEKSIPRSVENEIRRRVRLRSSEIPYQQGRTWSIEGLSKLPDDERIQIRYRLYVNTLEFDDQRETIGVWLIRKPGADTYFPIPRKAMSGVFHELALPASVVDSDGTLTLRYENRDPGGQSVVLQNIDGPIALTAATEYWQNYARVVFVLLIKLIFLSAIGCATGAMFTTSMAVFFSFSYVVIGTMVVFLRSTFPELMDNQSVSVFSYIASSIRSAAAVITVSLNEFADINRLTRGELLELGRIVRAVIQLIVLRALPAIGIAVWYLGRRELGLVDRAS